MAGKRDQRKSQRFKLDLTNWKEEVSSSVVTNLACCIFVSMICIIFWQAKLQWLNDANLVLAALNLGMALHGELCRRFHSRTAIDRMHDEAFRRTLLSVDASRIANGLKPLSEIFDDERT